MKPINVLSLFDGMSCLQIALHELGIPVANYYASEVDKYAMQVTQANFPNTAQLGDVKNVSFFGLPKIDLFCAGFPCQPYSLAGKRKGLKDTRGLLIYDMFRLINETRPKYFLLENVVGFKSIDRKRPYRKLLTKLYKFGYRNIYVHILDSALVSAQSRKRLYITNIPGITPPADRGIMIRDILDNDFTDEDGVYLQQKPHGYNKGGMFTEKSPTLTSSGWQHQNHIIRLANTQPGGKGQNGWIYDINGKSATLCTTGGGEGQKIGCLKVGAAPALVELYYRKVSVNECRRLQTIPDWCLMQGVVSDSQCFRMMGNGFTIKMIMWILNFAPGFARMITQDLKSA